MGQGTLTGLESEALVAVPDLHVGAGCDERHLDGVLLAHLPHQPGQGRQQAPVDHEVDLGPHRQLRRVPEPQGARAEGDLAGHPALRTPRQTAGELRKIEVEGSINASGVLVADSIEFRASAALRVEALVDDIQAGQLILLGINVSVNDSTRYEDSVLDLENFSFSDISVGDYLEIRGYGDQGSFIATQIDRDDFGGDVAVRGFVESVSDPDFVILGVTISTSGATSFTDNDGVTDLTPAEFFGQANGRLVEASGTLIGAVINADEVEFED